MNSGRRFRSLHPRVASEISPSRVTGHNQSDGSSASPNQTTRVLNCETARTLRSTGVAVVSDRPRHLRTAETFFHRHDYHAEYRSERGIPSTGSTSGSRDSLSFAGRSLDVFSAGRRHCDPKSDRRGPAHFGLVRTTYILRGMWACSGIFLPHD